jgi:hypothetical protein
VPLSYKRVKTVVTIKRLVCHNWQDEDETNSYYKSLELNPPWASINVTIPGGTKYPADWNNVNKYCGTK